MIDLHFCEYNRSNQDYDTIFRPSGSGDYLLLLLKTPMKVYLKEGLTVTRENACILSLFFRRKSRAAVPSSGKPDFLSDGSPGIRRLFPPSAAGVFLLFSLPGRGHPLPGYGTVHRTLPKPFPPCCPKGRNGGPVSGLSEAPAGNALQLRAGLESGTPLQKRQP